jgi:hypothetical protein
MCDDIMDGHGSLGRHMVKLETYEKGSRRQFQAVFSALYELTFKDGMEPRSHEAVWSALENFWNRKLSIPTGGSAWGKSDKETLYPNVKKNIRRAFFPPEQRKRFIHLNSRLYVNNLLRGRPPEDPLIELKQGFCHLSDPPAENKEIFDEILATAVAMANHGPSAEGVILVGIADKLADAKRVKTLFNINTITIHGNPVTGTEEQIEYLGWNVDQWWRKWQQKIQSAKVSEEFSRSLAMSLRPVFCDGLLLWELKPKSIGKPISFNDRFFIRIGPATQEISADDFLAIMASSLEWRRGR